MNVNSALEFRLTPPSHLHRFLLQQNPGRLGTLVPAQPGYRWKLAVVECCLLLLRHTLSRGFMCNCRIQLVYNLGGGSCQSLRAPQCVSGVTSVFTSKMSDDDELLLLSAAAEAATIALAACSVKRRRKRAKRFRMRPLFYRRPSGKTTDASESFYAFWRVTLRRRVTLQNPLFRTPLNGEEKKLDSTSHPEACLKSKLKN